MVYRTDKGGGEGVITCKSTITLIYHTYSNMRFTENVFPLTPTLTLMSDVHDDIRKVMHGVIMKT